MDIASLPKEAQEEIFSLQKRLTESKAENKNWKLKYQLLEEKLALALLRQFARRAENVPDQIELFDTEDTVVTEEEPEEETISTYKRKKKGRKPLDENLPRKERIIDIPEEDKACACGTKLKKIGKEVSEKLHIIPPRVWVE